MKVTLAYGKSGLEVDFPEQGVEIIEPRFVKGLADEAGSLRHSLRHPVASPPLRKLATTESSVAIIFPDRTRAMPSDRVLPIVLSELEQVPKKNITLINAVGTHRPNTPQELEAMLGRDILDNYRIVQHQPRKRSSMVHLGASQYGNQVWVNKDFVQAKLKILTGFIEPHLFAGFSGGPKAVLLGVGAFESILRNHSAPMIDNPNATWGKTTNNPIYREMSEIAALVEPEFIVNVTLNKDREITGVFSGNWKEAHAQGCHFARESVMRPVEKPFDVVVTTNSGFPLDLNLYQAVKGMSAASRIVKQGGTIIMASECSDGVPAEGNFGQLLRSSQSPTQLLSNIQNHTEPIQDQWQVQILAKILMQSEVYLYSTLPDSEVLGALLKPVRDIGGLVRQLQAASGSDFRIAVLPEGPQTVPYVTGKGLSNT